MMLQFRLTQVSEYGAGGLPDRGGRVGEIQKEGVGVGQPVRQHHL